MSVSLLKNQFRYSSKIAVKKRSKIKNITADWLFPQMGSMGLRLLSTEPPPSKVDVPAAAAASELSSAAESFAPLSATVSAAEAAVVAEELAVEGKEIRKDFLSVYILNWA